MRLVRFNFAWRAVLERERERERVLSAESFLSSLCLNRLGFSDTKDVYQPHKLFGIMLEWSYVLP